MTKESKPTTVMIFYFGRLKYLGSGWLYQNTKAHFMKSNFSRPFRFNNFIPLQAVTEKSTMTKVVEIGKRHPKGSPFHSMISWVYNNHYAILIPH